MRLGRAAIEQHAVVLAQGDAGSSIVAQYGDQARTRPLDGRDPVQCTAAAEQDQRAGVTVTVQVSLGYGDRLR